MLGKKTIGYYVPTAVVRTGVGRRPRGTIYISQTATSVNHDRVRG